VQVQTACTSYNKQDHLNEKTMIKYIAALMIVSAPLLAQNSAIMTPSPQISVSSRGEVKVDPDRATIQISVQTKAATAAAAAADNAAKQKAVIDALRALGLGEKDISTSDYSVTPEQRYEPNKEPTVIGYTVTNTLSVEVISLKQVGPVIDAALAKGANMITSLQFTSSNTEAARRQAITIAVQRARGDADAAAKAAGGSLGALLEVSIGGYSSPPPRPFDMKVSATAMREQVETPVNPGEQTIAADVTTRWAFVPGNR
jgi:uncharacterized protein